MADKVKAELFQVCSSIKLNNCAVFADREAALLGWVFVFSLAEWSNADGHLDVIAIIHTFFIGSKDIVTQCRAHSSVWASIGSKHLIYLIFIVLKIQDRCFGALGLNLSLLTFCKHRRIAWQFASGLKVLNGLLVVLDIDNGNLRWDRAWFLWPILLGVGIYFKVLHVQLVRFMALTLLGVLVFSLRVGFLLVWIPLVLGPGNFSVFCCWTVGTFSSLSSV